MTYFKTCILLIVVLCLTGCSGISASLPRPSPETTQTDKHLSTTTPIAITVTSSVMTSPTSIATVDAQFPTPTYSSGLPQYTPTTTHMIINTPLETHCLEILPGLPPNAGLTGILALAPFPEDIKNPAILLDLETSSQKLLPPGENETQGGFAVSPNGQWLAFEQNIWQQGEIIERRLVIEDASGQQRAVIPLSENEAKTGWRGYWLDDQHLITWVDEYPYPTRVINPFSGEQHLIEIGGDSWYYPFAGINWRAPFVYDPTLRWLVYPGYITSTTGVAGEYDLGLLLEDRQAQKIVGSVATLPNYSFPLSSPQWSPDGAQFVFVAAAAAVYDRYQKTDEFFSADRDGQVTRLTYLTDIYPNMSISYYSWSPDGHKIAFWMHGYSPDSQLSPGDDDMLAVLDLDTLQVTNFCIPAKNYASSGSTPVWSLDGRQIVVASRHGETRRVVFVDIAQEYAAVLVEENLMPVGWMIAQP